VEDDPAIAGVLEDVLHENGYVVTIAHTGVEALSALRVGHMDLVLLDLMLPDMNGWTFSQVRIEHKRGNRFFTLAGIDQLFQARDEVARNEAQSGRLRPAFVQQQAVNTSTPHGGFEGNTATKRVPIEIHGAGKHLNRGEHVLHLTFDRVLGRITASATTTSVHHMDGEPFGE